MRFWKLIAVPIALLASQALAENWVPVAYNDEDGSSVDVDKDSIRRGGDGLVYFTDDQDATYSAEAADCPRRLIYLLSLDLVIGKHVDFPNWRNDGKAVEAKSFGEAELQFACANAGLRRSGSRY